MAGEDETGLDNVDEPKLPEFKLDPKQALGFISFFNKLPEDERVVRFFDRKDYYTAHGDNATFIAKTYYKTMTALRQLGSGSTTLSGVSISRSMYEGIIRDLLLERTDHSVELYEGSGSKWVMSKAGTPGKLDSFEDVLFASNEMKETPVVMAVHMAVRENERSIGIAFVDMTRRTLGMTEFVDDDQFGNLESAMIALGCRECIMPQDSGKSSDARKLRDMMERCNVLLTERKKSEFRVRDLEQDLSRLVKGPVEQHRDLVAGQEGAASALAALLAYTDLLSDDRAYGKYVLQPYSLDKYMRLDAAALRALNVMESKMDGNKNFSLSGLMNRTSTAGMGKRLLNRWLKQPLLDVSEITTRHDVVQAFVESASMRQDVRQHLRRIPDIERLSRKVEKGSAGLQDIVKLYQASVRLPFIKEALDAYEGEFSAVLKERYTQSFGEWVGPEHLGKYDGLVESAVDLDQLQHGEYIISPAYDNSLQEIKSERDKVEEQIHKLHQQAANDLGLQVEKSLKLDKSPIFGHVFRITKKEEPSIRKKLTSSYVTLETRKDGVKFTNSKLRRCSEQYSKLSEEYVATQRELVSKVVEVAATFLEVFEGVALLLADMDVLVGFADLAASSPSPYVRPTMTPGDEGDLILEGSRHPCVEAQDDVNFIPNDCCLVRGKSWFQIITGPNMGGKSTFIRQVGVNVLMAQVGSFVPCDRADISVRDCIFARVGAGDCQLRGVSTFMAEMLETASILKSATERSLIIIDELGRGTSTYDGFGLAWAICEYLVEVIRAPALFATHFHELTALASREGPLVHGPARGPLVGIANYHVSAHIDDKSRKLAMLYKVEEGPCDQSFGIHVAEFAHFPPDVVQLAREKAAELEDFSPSGLDIITKQREEVGAKRKRVIGPDDISRGKDRARQFLLDFAALPLDRMSAEVAMEEVAKLKTAFLEEAESSPWLQQLCLEGMRT
ncbi:DNA mismatch repair protein MSH2 [Marchantia polymorpha subsp. ruderalis]|uniref:DNA mismatch repair protein MSH2 n=2 Tax=Marchantia polymorpha TaxID=3197 RepID=A0AAF6B7R7_MARPO|nr:hypothetical protein MARPO_0120s0004 [Marchantia polymorpha]BBN08051.1 hypothetical protein Mp_4g08420 [Marchantia polymorpha subsp. ruderalis]|eukprot:PTQ30720.1 hypothetical protein MARPO_0120s0004 [Marchantia polymorpha]